MAKQPTFDSKNVQANLSALMKQVHAQLPDIVKEAHDSVAKLAVEYAPLDTGALEASMKQVVRKNAVGIEADITFGNGSVDYALEQHEFWPKKRKKGKMKYLEHALFESMPMMLDSFQKGLNKALSAVKGLKRG